MIESFADDVVPRPLTASDGGDGGATSSSRASSDDEAGHAAAIELGRGKAREALARPRDAKNTCVRFPCKLKSEEACEQLVALEEAARELGRQKAREQLAAADAAAAEAAAEAAAQQLLDEETAAPLDKGKAMSRAEAKAKGNRT